MDQTNTYGTPPPIIDKLSIIFEERGLYSLDETKLRYGHNTEDWAEVDRFTRHAQLSNMSKFNYSGAPNKGDR